MRPDAQLAVTWITAYVQIARVRGTVPQHTPNPAAGRADLHSLEGRNGRSQDLRAAFSGPRGEAATAAAGQSSRPNPTAHPAGVLEDPMHQRISGMRCLVRALRPTRLGIVVIVALVGLVVPAPAMAAADASSSAAADLCAKVASRAGFSGDRLVTAVAVGMGESSCRPDAYLSNGPTKGCPNGSVDRGLWQINSCWHPSVSKSCAYDAQCNANAAYRISSGGANWKPWVAYTNGRYENYLDEARAAVGRLS